MTMEPPGRIEVIRASYPEEPEVGPALARVLLDQVASGFRGPTLRISRPGRALAFGRRDVVSPGYRAASITAAERGFPGIERISGGRATAYTDRTVVLGFTIPTREPARTTTSRFEWVSSLVADSLVAMGAPAGVGEIEGEYCPGRYSVNLGGEVKVAGIGQRMIPGAAHVGVVLTIGGSRELREALMPVYRELGLEWLPGTAGAVEDLVPGTSSDDFESALLRRLGRISAISGVDLDEETESAARAASAGFRSPGRSGSGHDQGRGG